MAAANIVDEETYYSKGDICYKGGKKVCLTSLFRFQKEICILKKDKEGVPMYKIKEILKKISENKDNSLNEDGRGKLAEENILHKHLIEKDIKNLEKLYFIDYVSNKIDADEDDISKSDYFEFIKTNNDYREFIQDIYTHFYFNIITEINSTINKEDEKLNQEKEMIKPEKFYNNYITTFENAGGYKKIFNILKLPVLPKEFLKKYKNNPVKDDFKSKYQETLRQQSNQIGQMTDNLMKYIQRLFIIGRESDEEEEFVKIHPDLTISSLKKYIIDIRKIILDIYITGHKHVLTNLINQINAYNIKSEGEEQPVANPESENSPDVTGISGESVTSPKKPDPEDLVNAKKEGADKEGAEKEGANTENAEKEGPDKKDDKKDDKKASGQEKRTKNYDDDLDNDEDDYDEDDYNEDYDDEDDYDDEAEYRRARRRRRLLRKRRRLRRRATL